LRVPGSVTVAADNVEMDIHIDDIGGTIRVSGGRALAAFLRKLGSARARSGREPIAALADPKTMRLVELGLVEEAAHRSIVRCRSEASPITIAGAGPGGLGNLTVAALDRIRRADVIFVDALVDVEILDEAMPDARIVEVGARCGGERPLSPEDLALEMVSCAKRGASVLRLHGGDPSLFARTFEELAAFETLGVDVEILPGVTSMSACAASARMPLTARGLARGVSVRTGHTAAGYTGGELDREEETVVVMMGLGALHAIAAGLIAEGRSERVPAVVVGRAGLRDERIVSATLGSIAIAAREAGIRSPATLIVGWVAERAAERWVSTRSPGP
jgi:uroporphyrin-III C-methyltransferase